MPSSVADFLLWEKTEDKGRKSENSSQTKLTTDTLGTGNADFNRAISYSTFTWIVTLNMYS